MDDLDVNEELSSCTRFQLLLEILYHDDYLLQDILREGRRKFVPNKRLKVWVIIMYIAVF